MSSAEAIGRLNEVLQSKRLELRSPLTLATRLSLSYFSMSMLLVILTSVILYAGTVHALRSVDDQVLEKRLLTLRAILVDPTSNEGYLAHEVSEDLDGPRRVYLRVISTRDALNVETPHSPDKNLFPDVGNQPFDSILRDIFVGEDGRTFRAATSRVALPVDWKAPEAVIQVAVDTSLDGEVLEQMRWLIAGLVSVAVVGCWYLARVLVVREIRPLRAIAAATANVDANSLTHRVPVDGLPAELHELATNFNDMLARLDVAYRGLRQYADNIAHELRSPVNRMLLGCEVSLMRARSAAHYRELLLSNIEECRRLSNILQSLLFLARADNAQTPLSRQAIDVRAELACLKDFFQATADECKVALIVDVEEGLSITADKGLLQRAVSNVVANAIGHTPPGGTVTVAARTNDGGVLIEVSDTGEGIANKHLAHVCERFYRADQVRSAGDHHLGLGLSITKSIVDLHGGTLSIESEVGRGTIVRMSFPRIVEAAKAARVEASNEAGRA